MSQLSFSLDSSSSSSASLLVRDEHGQYLPASADQILDAARQVIDARMPKGMLFTAPGDVKDYLRTKLGGYDHEVFAVMLLSAEHRLIDYVEMFHGTISQASVYPREVVKLALRHHAAALVMSHGHPSGSQNVSAADVALTKRLTEALMLVDVRVLDHIIVAGNTAVSMAEGGLM